jgi:hypothetical protein
MIRSPARLTNALWNTLRAEMREIMIAAARSSRTLTYSELCLTLTTATLHYHSPLLTRLLVEIGDEEYRAGRPVLPAVVVSKQTGMPGAGYFKIGLGDKVTDDPEARWREDLQRVFDYWSKA